MLVTVEELAARLPFVLDADEEREAAGALEDLSFDAQAIGLSSWVDSASTPTAVKNLILRAAARHMKNYEGYTVSRAGDETVQWAEQETPGTATFTADEKKIIAQVAGKGGKFIGTVNVIAYKQADRKIGYVPVQYGGEDFPMFADPVEPW